MTEAERTHFGTEIPPNGILPPDMREDNAASKRQLPEAMAARRWQPGQSGNPGGSHKRNYKIAELARTHTEEAIEKLVTLMRNSESDDIQFRCAEALLNRGYGRAPLAIKLDDEGGGDAAARASIVEILRVAAHNATLALAPQPIENNQEIIPPESKTPPQGGAAFMAGMAVGAAISAALDED